MQMTLTRLATTAGLIGILFFGAFSAAYAHNGIDHDAPQDVQLRQELRFLLIKRVAMLLLQKVGMEQPQVPATTHSLEIIAEAHGGRTHIHVHKPGQEEESFFLDGIALSDQKEVIDAVVLKTSLAKHEVEAAITFPAPEPADHSHEEEEHEHEDQDHTSIHIMADGTVMAKDGTKVEGATILSDGKIELSDGTIVEPEFDLR